MDIQLPQILFQIVNFSVVAGALTYLLYKPVTKIFEERAERIESGLKAAEENLAERNKVEEYRKKVKKEAEKQAMTILDEAKVNAEERGKQILSEAKQQAETQRVKLMEDWQGEKGQMMQHLRQDMVDAVITTTKKVIGSLDAKAHAKLIDQEIDAIIKTL